MTSILVNEQSFFSGFLYGVRFNTPLDSDIDFIVLKSYTTCVYCYSSAGPLEVDIKSAVVEDTYGTCFVCCLLSVIVIPAIINYTRK